MTAAEARKKQINNNFHLTEELNIILSEIDKITYSNTTNEFNIHGEYKASIVVLNHLEKDLGFDVEYVYSSLNTRHGKVDNLESICIKW